MDSAGRGDDGTEEGTSENDARCAAWDGALDAGYSALAAEFDSEESRADRKSARDRHALRAADLLDVMRMQIRPLLSECTPISKQDREEILGYDRDTGV